VRYIGVDLHKQNFVVCFPGEDETTKLRTYALTDAGLNAFCRDLRPDDQMAVETAPNAYYFYDRVQPAVAKVVLVDPYRFAVIAKSKKKTDRHDAVTLARFLKLGWLPTLTSSPKGGPVLGSKFTLWGGAQDAEIAVHGDRNRLRGQVGGGGSAGRGGRPQVRREPEDDLRLAHQVRGAVRERGCAAQAARGRKPKAQANGRRALTR